MVLFSRFCKLCLALVVVTSFSCSSKSSSSSSDMGEEVSEAGDVIKDEAKTAGKNVKNKLGSKKTKKDGSTTTVGHAKKKTDALKKKVKSEE